MNDEGNENFVSIIVNIQIILDSGVDTLEVMSQAPKRKPKAHLIEFSVIQPNRTKALT